MDVEIEIAELKRRMTVLENEVEADRELPVRLFSYVREMRDDVAILRSHAVATGKHVEAIDTVGSAGATHGSGRTTAA